MITINSDHDEIRTNRALLKIPQVFLTQAIKVCDLPVQIQQL